MLRTTKTRCRRFSWLVGAGAFVIACGVSWPVWCEPLTRPGPPQISIEVLIIADSGSDWLTLIENRDLKKSNSGSGALFLKDLPSPVGVAVDKSNNLWVSVEGNLTFPPGLLQFTPAQLANLKTNPSPTPQTVLFGSVFVNPGGLAFDQQGTLWAADASGSLFGFNSALLSAGSKSNVTPSFTITSSAFNQPEFPTFDQTGNLWVSNVGNSTVLKFNTGDLGSSGTKVPAIILSDDGSGSLDAPGQLVFDKKGNLYVPNSGNASLSVFGANQLSTSGAPTPEVFISGPPFDHPVGEVFDQRGFFVDDGNGELLEILIKNLKKSGPPQVKVTIGPILSDEPGQMTRFPTH